MAALGQPAGGDVRLANWPIHVVGDLDFDGEFDDFEEWTATDENGEYWFEGLVHGTYQVFEGEQPGWWPKTAPPEPITIFSGQEYVALPGQAHLPDPSQVDHVTMKTEIPWEGLAFGNFEHGSIHGYKFLDRNGNGIDDDGFDGQDEEPSLSDWTIEIWGDLDFDGDFDDFHDSTVTDDTGQYWFTGLDHGEYQVREVLKDGYTQTTEDPADITIYSGQEYVAVPGQAMLFGEHHFSWWDTDAGVVVLPQGDPAPSADAVHLLDLDEWHLSQQDTTDWYNGVAIPGLPANPFDAGNRTGLIGAIPAIAGAEAFVYQIRNVNYDSGNGFSFSDLIPPGPGVNELSGINITDTHGVLDAAALVAGSQFMFTSQGASDILDMTPGSAGAQDWDFNAFSFGSFEWDIITENGTGVVMGDAPAVFGYAMPGMWSDDVNDGWVHSWNDPAPASSQVNIADALSGFSGPAGVSMKTEVNWEGLAFGNTRRASIHGFKFEDYNADGIYNPMDGDLPLGGIEFLAIKAGEPGLNSHWVQVEPDFKPDTIMEAIDTLTLVPGDPGFIAEADLMVSGVDFADHDDPGQLTPETDLPPFGGDDPLFAVEYAGLIWLTDDGDYEFDMRHDDGFRLEIGGNVIMEFDGNTAPTNTTATVSLDAGLYTFSLVSWEQGEIFTNELSWKPPGAAEFSVPGEDIFHKAELVGHEISDHGGEFWFLDVSPGDYVIKEIQPAWTDVMPSTPTESWLTVEAGFEYVWKEGASMQEPLPDGSLPRPEIVVGERLMFGNFIKGSIHGFKFKDMDADGVYEPDVIDDNGAIAPADVPWGGFRFELTGIDGMGNPVGPIVTTTNHDGEFWFETLKPGTYTVREIIDDPDLIWNSTPSERTLTVGTRDELAWRKGAAMLEDGTLKYEKVVGEAADVRQLRQGIDPWLQVRRSRRGRPIRTGSRWRRHTLGRIPVRSVGRFRRRR